MRSSRKIIEIGSESQCEKLQEQEPPAPRHKRIQKTTKNTRSSTRTRTENALKEKESDEIKTYPIQFIQLQENNHICPLCLEPIAKAMTALCGHSHCQFCLSEYLLFFEDCLKCGQNLRNSKHSYNRTLDDLIIKLADSFGEEEQNQLKERWIKSVQYAQNRKVTSLEVGDLIDVRDKDYVWCQARIYRTICRMQESRTKYVCINYIGKPAAFNEEISQHSERLASHGFFTSRNDIPHYQRQQNGDLKVKSSLIFQHNGETVAVVQEKIDQ